MASLSTSPALGYMCRWRLVAQYMSFMSQRRRGLRQRWYATYQQLMAMADAQARQAELVTWQHMGEAVQVRAVAAHAR